MVDSISRVVFLAADGTFWPGGMAERRCHMIENSREKILFAATKIAQAHGYNGLNFRDLAEDVGIKAASIYYYFPGKADLAAAVAKRYWENAAAALETLLAESPDPAVALRRYPETFAGRLRMTIVCA